MTAVNLVCKYCHDRLEAFLAIEPGPPDSEQTPRADCRAICELPEYWNKTATWHWCVIYRIKSSLRRNIPLTFLLLDEYILNEYHVEEEVTAAIQD